MCGGCHKILRFIDQNDSSARRACRRLARAIPPNPFLGLQDCVDLIGGKRFPGNNVKRVRRGKIETSHQSRASMMTSPSRVNLTVNTPAREAKFLSQEVGKRNRIRKELLGYRHVLANSTGDNQLIQRGTTQQAKKSKGITGRLAGRCHCCKRYHRIPASCRVVVDKLFCDLGLL